MNNTVNDKNNFRLLRLIAAVFVMIANAFVILEIPTQQPALWYGEISINFGNIGYHIFFTTAGFLVTTSLFNSDSLTHYFSKRLARLIPALFVANAFCVLLGCFITTFSFKEYVFNIHTWAYLLKNSTLVISPDHLPGVFAAKNNNTFNSFIQALRILALCDIILLVASYQIVTRKWVYLSCFLCCELAGIYIASTGNPVVFGADINTAFSHCTYFFLGSLMYCFKDVIRFKWFYANILMAVAFATATTFFAEFTLAVFFAYCFIIIATAKPIFKIRGYPFSYGLYLYSLPVQQLLVLYFGRPIDAWLLLALAIPVTTALAASSWLLVEKPVLLRKNWFKGA